MTRHSLTTLLLTTLIIGCADQPAGPILTDTPSYEIYDAAHNEGVDGFYFLPPLVSAPTFDGVFDASLNPQVQICEWDGACVADVVTFSTTAGTGSETVRLDADGEQYIVNWHTDEFQLNADANYRIAVSVAGTPMGHADVDVVDSGRELKNVDTGEYIALKDGRTLPIAFRIEEGAVFVIGSDGGAFVAEDGQVALDLAPGAVPDSEDLGITVTSVGGDIVTDGPELIGGTVYEFGPDGTDFTAPVELTITYDAAALPDGIDEATLTLYTEEDDGRWIIVPSVVDPVSKSVTGIISGFSAKAIGDAGSGYGHTCTIAADEFVYCWGMNTSGQLGLGSTAPKSKPTPTRIQSNRRFVELAVGNYHTCAISTNDEVLCWGDYFGSPIPAPTVLNIPSSAVPVRLTTGYRSTCALTADGTTFCWGQSNYGSLGVGIYLGTVTSPREIMGVKFDEIAMGNVASCGVDTAGEVWCWGLDKYGQLAGRVAQSNVPYPMNLGSHTAVDVGFWHTCAVAIDGQISCWGWNDQGQLGRGTTQPAKHQPATVDAPGTVFTSAQTSAFHSCGLDVTGIIWCWGYGGFGALGTGDTKPRLVPAKTLTPELFTTLVAGYNTTCGFTIGNELFCWGNNPYGQQGDGTTDPVLVPQLVPGLPVLLTIDPSPPQRVAGGNVHSCAIAQDARTYCWGSNAFGQLGDGAVSSRDRPVAVATSAQFVTMDATGSGACGIDPAGTTSCWGHWQTLGTGARFSSNVPNALAGFSFVTVTGGLGHACALDANGQAYCWGGNDDGRLGTGDTDFHLTPTPVAGGLEFAWITAGGSYTCGLTSTGEAYCWGSQFNGLLGNGETTGFSTTPQPVASTLRFRSISAGNAHTCAIAVDNDVYCWGFQLNPGGPIPQKLNDPKIFASVEVSAGYACGLEQVSAILYCWGGNNSGQLGDGTTTRRSGPTTPVNFDIQFSDFQGLGNHGCGRTMEELVYCWGRNLDGQVGVGFAGGNRTLPTRALVPTGSSIFVAAQDHLWFFDDFPLLLGQVADTGGTTLAFDPTGSLGAMVSGTDVWWVNAAAPSLTGRHFAGDPVDAIPWKGAIYHAGTSSLDGSTTSPGVIEAVSSTIPGTTRLTIPIPAAPHDLSTNGGAWLFVGGKDGSIFGVTGGSAFPIATLGSGPAVVAASNVTDQVVWASAVGSASFRGFDTSGATVATIGLNFADIRSIAVSRDDGLALVGHGDLKTASLIDLRTSQLLHEVALGEPALTTAFSPDGSIAYAGTVNSVAVIDVKTGYLLRKVWAGPNVTGLATREN